MAVLKCLDEQKLSDGKKRNRMFISYAEDADREILESVLQNMNGHDDTIVYTAEPDAEFTDGMKAELDTMDDMMFISSPSLYSAKPARTILHDIPYMIGRKVLPFSIEQKDRKWQNLLDEIFLTIYHSKGETELCVHEVRKLITEAIRVVTRDYEKEVPEEMEEPLYRARLSLCSEICDEETTYRTKVVKATALLNLGNLLRLRGRTDEAAGLVREAYLICTALTEEIPSWDSLIFQAKAASIMGNMAEKAGEGRKEKRWYRRTAEACRTLKNDRSMKDSPEMPELDMTYIDALMHLSAIYREEGALKDALDALFTADLLMKDYPGMVTKEVQDAIGANIEELASHVLTGMEA